MEGIAENCKGWRRDGALEVEHLRKVAAKSMVRMTENADETFCGSGDGRQVIIREGSQKCEQTGTRMFGETPGYAEGTRWGRVVVGDEFGVAPVLKVARSHQSEGQYNEKG